MSLSPRGPAPRAAFRRRFRVARVELRRRDDFEHLDVPGVRDLAVADARRLVETSAGAHRALPDALVLELHPALEHVDELHVAVVVVPLAVRCLARQRLDHVRDHLAAGGTFDAEVAISEVAAQAASLELRPRAVADVEALGACVHWSPPRVG